MYGKWFYGGEEMEVIDISSSEDYTSSDETSSKLYSSSDEKEDFDDVSSDEKEDFDEDLQRTQKKMTTYQSKLDDAKEEMDVITFYIYDDIVGRYKVF